MNFALGSRDFAVGILGATLLALSAPAQYTVASATGPFLVPSSGSGGTSGANWATPTLPTGNDITQVPLTGGGVPLTAINVRSIKIYGLSHTWAGDMYIALEDPSGSTKYTLIARPDFPNLALGSPFDLVNADITIVDPITPLALDVPTTTDIPTGTYKQYFNATWGSGFQLAAISNTAMLSIPIAAGVWKLTIYDWAGGDMGQFDHWEMSGDTVPLAFCTAGTSVHGCVGSISANNNPDVTLTTSCVINVTNVEGQKFGIIFYGIDNTGFTPIPWGSGNNSFLCVKPPTARTLAVNSNGTNHLCDGNLTLTFNLFLSSHPLSYGLPFLSGQHVFAQGWYRDPPGTNLSNALEMTFQ